MRTTSTQLPKKQNCRTEIKLLEKSDAQTLGRTVGVEKYVPPCTYYKRNPSSNYNTLDKHPNPGKCKYAIAPVSNIVQG
jgi:hypothetical protein